MRATEELSVSAGTARGQHPASRDRLVAGASVVTSGAVLGLNFVLLKVALRAAGPMTIQALATALTALFFGSYLLLRRTRPSLRRRDFTWAVVAALLVGVGGSSATAFGVQRIAAGTTALILATTPILTLIVRAVLLRNRPEVTKIVGCGLGLCGVATIVWGSAGGGRSQLMGSLLVLLAALLWALALVVMREKLASVPAPTVVAWQMIASAPVLLVVALATERLNVHWSPAFLGAVVYLGLAGKGLSFLFQMIAVSRASDLLASSTAFLTPAFGVLFAAGILAERIGKAEVAGVGVIFVGLAAITFGTPQAKAGPLGRIRSCGRGHAVCSGVISITRRRR